MVDEPYGKPSDQHPDAPGAANGWDEARGTFEGRPFPSEAEWLSLPVPPVADDFVARTLAALQQDRAAEPAAGDVADAGGGVAGHLLTPDLLRHFAPPEPSTDFVARTLRAVQDDRRARWRELLARHVAPEPTPEFVARTLRALADDRPAAAAVRRARSASPWQKFGRWLPPLLLAAATVTALVLLQPRPSAPLEQRLAAATRPSSALAYAATPLAAVFGAAAEAAEPRALSSGGADGMWLLLHRRGR